VARKTGTVAWFNDRKGFGFITGEDGMDVFVHYQEIERDGFQTLNVGERVSFELADEEKGPKALAVTVLLSG
jgi:CspA family cold shock protein